MNNDLFLYYFGKCISKFIHKVFFRLKIEGKENIPKIGPAIIAPNHSSYLDPPLVGSALKRPLCFMAKAELFKTPFLNYLFRQLNSFPVNRNFKDIRAIREALSILKSEKLLLVFPEGRRIKGNKLGEPKGGIGFLVYKSGAPVIPTLLVNTHKIKMFPRLKVRFGKPIYFKDNIPPNIAKRDVYLYIAETILLNIKKLDYEEQYTI